MPKEVFVDWKRLPQIRIDPLTGKSVIISAQRRLRVRKEAEVVAYPASLPEFLDSCPFCPRNEEETPKELVRVPDPANPQKWLVRGFPNLFPILMIEEAENLVSNQGFFREYIKGGVGAHEIIVESPKHNAYLSSLSEEEIQAIFEAMSQRYFDLKGDPRFRYFYAFKNYGLGATQDHPHWQIEARVFAPQIIYEKWQRLNEYRIKHGKCFLCQRWQAEKEGGRAVLETKEFIAYIPFAPSEPYEVMIMPKGHYSNFARHLQSKETSFEFAGMLKEVMRRVKKTLQKETVGEEQWEKVSDPPYLFCFYTAPYDDDADGYYHWHLDFLPRTTHKMGHERGTGEDVIPAFPEEVAEILRQI